MNSFSLVVLLLSIVGSTLAEYPYYGKLIQRGWGTQVLQGDIYLVDNTTFQVIGFTFDASTTDAAFMLGSGNTYTQIAAGSGIDTTATILANPSGQMERLRSYTGENVVVTVPTGMSVTDYAYIAVGKIANKELIGGANIPTGIQVPMPTNIGTFTERAHQVTSGPVTVINDRTIMIESFTYDGYGPDAFFYVGTTSRVVLQSAPYGKIPDENGVSDRKAGRYNRQDIILTLPDTISATDLTWLSMFCISYSHNFGEVFFPNTLNVPPYLETVMPEVNNMVNCEPLSDDLQISWAVTGDSIMLELAGRIDRNVDYMAFGLSGSITRSQMIGSDVVVADYKENREPRAVDYYIQDRAQCSNNGGVCPDTSSFVSSTDDVMLVSGRVSQGITRVSYTRALVTADVASGKDQQYKTDGTPQQIVWSIGPINSLDQAAKHYSEGGVIRVSKAINFGRTVVDNCPIFQPKNKVVLPPFKPHHLYGKEGTVFTAEIGQSVSEQGYKAITGLPSWGIAWYINGILVPELHLKRGVAYTFRVAGGTNNATGSKYHPLYFTNSAEGGYQQTSEGVIYQAMEGGMLKDFAVGGYCEWKSNLTAEEKTYNCFEELKQDLYLECDNGTIGYTEFVFTPTSAMPNTLYYQCYSHKNLGWKINLYDELPATEIPAEDCTASTASNPGNPGTTSTAARANTSPTRIALGTNRQFAGNSATILYPQVLAYALLVFVACLLA